MNDVLVKCQTTALQKVDWLLDMEKKAPFTSNEPHFSDYRRKYLKSYREARHSYLRAGKSYPMLIEEADQYDQALRYMASTRAYFQGLHTGVLSPISVRSLTVPPVTFMRFTDMVPMVIDEELLRGLDWDRGLYPTLTKELGITGPGSLDKAKEYLQERPEDKSRREILLKKLERLRFAKRELQSI